MLSAAQGFTYNKFEKPNDWPKLKDTFDYDIRDGKLLGGNEHLYLSGPVTYTKVGNPTIIDGIASGFSRTNFLSITNSTFDPSTDDFEINAKVRYGSSIAGDIICENNNNWFQLTEKNGRFMFVYMNTNTSALDWVEIMQSIQSNTDYWLRVIRSGTNLTTYYSLDGNNYIAGNTRSNVAISTHTYIQQINIGCMGSGISGDTYCTGSIDLNETYIKVNDRLWFYGKNYTTKNMVPVPAGLEYNNTTTPEIGWVYTSNELVKGPVNYTVNGTPSIIDNNVNNFSGTSYLKLGSLNTTSGTPFEFQVKFKTGNDLDDGIGIIYGGNTFRFGRFTGNILGIRIGSSASSGYSTHTLNYVIQANTTYIWKTIYKNNNLTYTLYNENYEILGTNTNEDISRFISSSAITLGRVNSTTYFHGSIDLNETYIKVNGQPWFGNVSKFQEFIPAPKGTMICKDDTHGLAVETPTINGQVNYTVVGSPKISDGILSDLSSSDYLNLDVNFAPINNTWEISCDFTTGNDVSGNQAILGTNNSCVPFIIDSGGIRAFLSSNGTSWNIIADPIIDTVESNKRYILKCEFTGSQYNWFSYENNTWILKKSVNSSSKVYSSSVMRLGYNSGTETYFKGSINLNETYIKINDQYWFKPTTTVLKSKLIGSANYTVNGSPTIVDGIASGFSDDNYLSLPNYTTTDISISRSAKIKFTTSDTIGELGLMGNGANFSINGFRTNGSSKLEARIRVGGSPTLAATNISATCDYVLQPNTTYLAKYVFENYSIKVYLYDENNTLLSSNEVQIDNSYTTTTSFAAFRIGRTQNGAFNGSIDLNETYIKVNEALWFGKEDWTPSTYTDNAIYLLGSHSTDYSTYNTQGINPTIETESDESGTYNVWIDNQEVYKEQSNPLDINWSNLALTTGYNITTPSTLKAHVIKVEPNNGNITRFSTDTNYKVENGLLTWASPKLYLEGPTQYTVVGSPTIENGIASGFSNDNYLTLPAFPQFDDIEFVYLLKSGWTKNSSNLLSFISQKFFIAIENDNTIQASFLNSLTGNRLNLRTDNTINNINDIYIKVYYSNNSQYIATSENGQTWNNLKSSANEFSENISGAEISLFHNAAGGYFHGSIDLNNTYIKINNELWFGKIYTSETDVPVPANFTYGNTTTSSNGTVNLTTQEFSADTLATYGKDN